MVGVKEDLMLQQHAGDPEQPVGNAAQGPAIGVATRPKSLIAAAACAVGLHSDGFCQGSRQPVSSELG